MPTAQNSTTQATLTDASGPLVFCHFMVGIVSNRRSASDYDSDMIGAKSYGIDAFSLNIGVDPYSEEQLIYAYKSAANHGMKVFISFDFNWYSTSQAVDVATTIKKFGDETAQLKVDNKVFVSSFNGDQNGIVDLQAIRDSVGPDMPLYLTPNFHPYIAGFSSQPFDGALNWQAWDGDGYNKAPRRGHKVTTAMGDKIYQDALGGKGYIAPVSPWFSTHFGTEVSCSKNFVFPSDLLWFHRWNEILNMDRKPRFVEIITWNDYGESSYVAPLASPHCDDGSSNWVDDMPHNSWLDMAKPFIAAYHAGSTDVSPYIENDRIIYWYRINPKNADCGATHNTMSGSHNKPSANCSLGKPDGYDSMADSVFAVSLLKKAGKVTITSGQNTRIFDAPAGAHAFEMPMELGKQSFEIRVNETITLSGTSTKEITDKRTCGIWNFNAYVGTIPAGPPDKVNDGRFTKY